MEEEKNNKVLYGIAGGAFLLLVVFFFLYLFLKTSTAPTSQIFIEKQLPPYNKDLNIAQPYSRESHAYQLREGGAEYNKLYREARNARETLKDYDTAIQKYEEALLLAKHPDEKAQIKFEIALAKDAQRKETEAIEILKEIVADTSVSNIIRAGAIQQMGFIFYAKKDQPIFNAIFTGNSYREFLVQESQSTSMRNLFEYGSSLYPLAYPELRIATWYAQELARRSDGRIAQSSLSSEEIKSLILKKVENADKDIADIRAVYFSDGRIATALLRKAVVASFLDYAKDPFLGDGEVLFKEAIQESRIAGAVDTEDFATFNYAIFLAYNRPEKREEIVSVLSRFLNTTISDNFRIFLENEKGNTTGAREDIELLAGIDPNFKEFLNTQAGWNL